MVEETYSEVLMDLRKMRFPQSKPLNSPLLYWCFDYTTETSHRESLVYNQSIDILDDLINSENIEMLPDPTVHVIGVIFDKPELEAAGLEERSLSPSSVNRSKVRKDEDDTYMNTPRTINLPNTTRETSVEANSLREKAEAYSKEKNKGRITTITNKYMKPKGSIFFLF